MCLYYVSYVLLLLMEVRSYGMCQYISCITYGEKLFCKLMDVADSVTSEQIYDPLVLLRSSKPALEN